jgi:hypothetical protein
MPLSREQYDYLIKSHFLPSEIEEINNAKTASGDPMDIEAVLTSQAGISVIIDRQDWWKKALTPTSQGGFGKTAQWAMAQLRNLYVSKTGRRTFSFFDLIKAEYKPEDRDLTINEYRKMVSTRISLGKRLGKKYVSGQ